jgi:AraC-like DNA-binding protein
MLSTEKYINPKSDYYIYTPSSVARNLFLYPSIIGHFKYEDGYKLYRESFDSYLLIFIKQGSCIVNTLGQTFTASENQIVFLNCYQPHSYESNGPWEAEWLHFDGPLAQAYYENITQNKNVVINLSSTYRFEKYLSKMYTAFKNSDPISDAKMNNWIVNLMTELFVSRESSDKSIGSNDIIEDIVSYIMDHLSEELSLEELADKANLSPFYFSRLFKKETGFSPHDYILTSRINHAKYLLLTSQLSVKDICFKLGFSSESAFCTAFKKKTNQSPGDFRSNN